MGCRGISCCSTINILNKRKKVQKRGGTKPKPSVRAKKNQNKKKAKKED